MKHPVDLYSILLGVSGLVGTGLVQEFGNNIDSLWPGHGKAVVGLIAAAATASAIILRIVYNPTPPPGTAPVVVAVNPIPTNHA